MKKIILSLIAVFTMSCMVAAGPVAATAAADYDCNGVKTSLDYGCSDYDTDGISFIFMYIINFMSIGVGIAVVAGIAWGGLTYARSGGNSSAAKEGIDTIRNAIIGLVLFLGLWALANFLVPGGAFNLNKKVATYTPKTATVGTKSTSSSSGTGTASSATSSATTTLAGIDKFNFRDASGSGVIKSGILYRSGYLAQADSKTEQAALKTLLSGGKVIDLREASDIKTDGKDPTLSGVSYKNIAIDGTTDYTKFVNGKAGEAASVAFGKVIKEIANTSGPVLIHCTHGKDRTGWTVAMIMYALGASDAQVMEEYMRSSGETAGKNVTEAMLNTGLSAVKAKYGTIGNYLTNGLKLTKADITALKQKLGA